MTTYSANRQEKPSTVATATANATLLRRECAGVDVCERRTKGAARPNDATERVCDSAGFGHDFGSFRILPNDQSPTQSGELGNELTQGGTQAPSPKTAPAVEAEKMSSGGAVVDSIDLVTSTSGAVGGYQEKEDKCDASLNKPGPFNDTTKGSVANVHQVHFHLSKGKGTDLYAKRIVKRTAVGQGKSFDKSGPDGPPAHEVKYKDDKLVIADAPGWCSTIKQDEFPVTYKADFALYAIDPLGPNIVASIAYHVEIEKKSLGESAPKNTVSVTQRSLTGAVASPVKPEKKD